MNLNSSPNSPFPMHQITTYDTNDHHYHPFPSNPNSLSCRIFFNSSPQDQSGFYDHHQLYHPQDDNYGYEMKRKVESGLKLTLWKKEDEGQNGNFPVKWMSSKMRLMQKMKNPGADQKLQPSSSETSSNSSSYNNNNNNAPIRVCADCNTTKTPLWRSGPKGPKSLCNACGIRQRKARRAMAAAAAAASGSADQPPVVKIKVQQKDKAGKNGAQLKKRCKTALAASGGVGSPSKGKKKIDFENFLINISKNLAFQRVFPEDEKDAAILLMALSSGLVNG